MKMLKNKYTTKQANQVVDSLRNKQHCNKDIGVKIKIIPMSINTIVTTGSNFNPFPVIPDTRS